MSDPSNAGPFPTPGAHADPITEEVPASAKPAGWYADDNDIIRWWNGDEWDVGAPAPTPPPTGFAPPGYPPPQAGFPPPPGFASPPGYAPPPPGYATAPPGYGYAGAPGPMPMYPPAQGASNARSMALVAHLGAVVGGFVLPLVVMLTSGKEDPFVRYHAVEALNFQLTYLVFVLGGMFISLITFGLGLFIFLPLFFIVAIGHIALAIQAMMAANRGEWYRYPINWRMVK